MTERIDLSALRTREARLYDAASRAFDRAQRAMAKRPRGSRLEASFRAKWWGLVCEATRIGRLADALELARQREREGW